MAEVSKQSFIKLFNSIAHHRHRYTVFSDFVTMSAISLHNAVSMDEALEQEYLSIVKGYSHEEIAAFPKLFGELVMLLEAEPRDVLGQLFMELDLGNDHTGQFFTPPEISYLMADLLYGHRLKNLKEPFVTLSEPASGSGGMVLAFVRLMLQNRLDPGKRLWVQCVDVDRVAAMMCYIQLSLWNVPAEIVIGNSLTLEVRDRLYTSAHYLGYWNVQLRLRHYRETAIASSKEVAESDDIEESNAKEYSKPTHVGDNLEFDFNL